MPVSVLLPLPVAGCYDYSVPSHLQISEGDFVEVPLRNRTVVGVVWEGSGQIPVGTRLKAVEGRLDAPPLPKNVRRFVDWVADYTVNPPGAVLKMAMSVPQALYPPSPTRGYQAVSPIPDTVRLTGARRRVLELLADGPPRTAAEVARDAGVSPSVISGLAQAGALAAVEMCAESESHPCWGGTPAVLSSTQAAAADTLCNAFETGFSVTLLDGIPGSGKSEVYFEVIRHAFGAGRQVLVLLPEIALSPAWLRRFVDRFGVPPAVWHTGVGQAEKRKTWRAVAEGRQQIVVGARSALFLPFTDLGLIVVDEEHDASFKQEEGVRYHARDMAVVRARLSDCACVLASATPSLETMANVHDGRYGRVCLPHRHAGAVMPAIRLIDLRADRPASGCWISAALRDAMVETLDRRQQTLLFLNRRGYAPLTLCRACGHRIRCPSCTAWLVEHRAIGRWTCHHCGYSMASAEDCPACGEEGTLAACGPGVERLLEEVTALAPDARIAIAASDTLPTPSSVEALIDAMHAGAVDIVIGTQIVAKGHHFPNLTTVGVIDADLGLSGGDLRAAERTFQLLYQVIGRAGRASHAGTVLIQTSQPDDAVMAALAAGDRDRFYAAEEAARRAAGMPPFGRLAAVIISGTCEETVDRAARSLAGAAPHGTDVRILGPAPAPLSLLRGRHRRRFLVHRPSRSRLADFMRGWLARVSLPGTVRVEVDSDPVSFL